MKKSMFASLGAVVCVLLWGAIELVALGRARLVVRNHPACCERPASLPRP
jgi:hypothetical protein